MRFDLDVRSVVKKFGDFTAVKGVSFKVEQGKFFSILGPSGCGKTTLLRMIAGFLEPTSGEIYIRGNLVNGLPPNKRPVNLVFQNLALFPMMNVEENIAFGLRRRKVPNNEIKKKVKDILERVGLPGFEKKAISQLSGGQKQRIAIARCLVLEPSVLLLDEPLGALDLKLREQMKVELKKLQTEVGTTFVYITHDQSEALVMSDYVAVMNAGKFEQVDTPQNLYKYPQTAFVAQFVGDNNGWEAEVVSQDKGTALVQTSEGYQFHVKTLDHLNKKNCIFFVRPEAFIIKPDNKIDDLNRLKVRVKTILFDGANSRLLTVVENSEKEIIVALPQNKQFDYIKPGDVIELGWHPENCIAFERE
ncbi:ABC transporter ATP-binding protein [Deferribacter autotrophicus]|uniref:ABC transporter ATP-binding protein n=1 Tax=Deferribacter autotrophicus TaxID=500465 RepID=A0A5A8EZX3_9BACT|nr:ABC transporter ATP-binding protein [Deferribacter autotrophicus]KAA0256924.1 ABC transporter ATP-binding protein [Deferribacter autotrophicus]